jgi:hypothetical protein
MLTGGSCLEEAVSKRLPRGGCIEEAASKRMPPEGCLICVGEYCGNIFVAE